MSNSSAIIQGKCPRCRKGDIFQFSLLSPSKFHKMNPQCPVCDVHFEREPGFFFGAMYVSYGFSVALFIAVGVVLTIIGEFSLVVYLVTTMITVLLLLPILFRYSRILFLYWFGGIRYDAQCGNKVHQ